MDALDEELFSAVSKGDANRVSCLLAEGANVNVICSSGRTALGSAAENGDIEILKMLLDSSGVSMCDSESHHCQKKLKGKKSRKETKPNVKLRLYDSDDDGDDESDSDMPHKAIGFDLNHSMREEEPTNDQGSLLQPAKEFDVNHQDVYGRSAVHYAAEHGHLEALALLASAGCKLDVADTDNFTPLHLAVARDHIPVIKMLLTEGAQVNRKTSDKTSALHMAASRGHSGAASALLDAGAAVDALDSADRTPLLLAVSRGHEHMTRLLLRHGAKVNIEEIHGYTPLCEAVWQRAVPLVQLLLEADAKVTQSHYLLHDAVIHRQLDMVALLVRAGCIVNLRDENGDTPLIVAARTGHVPVARLLLENGASVNYANSLTGSLPLHEAVEYIRPSQFDKFEAMFKLFLSFGAALNIQTCTGGDTPLFRAVLLERIQAAATLIRHGADVNLCNVVASVVDILALGLMRNNFPLVRLMVYAGFNLQKNLPVMKPHGPDSINSWLDHMRRNAMRLSDLCRIEIRRLLGTNLYVKVDQLFLPVSLKKFLLLEDISLND